MAWRTLHPKHAIERTRVAIVFSELVPEKLQQAARKNMDQRREELGFESVNDLSGTAFSLQINGPNAAVQPQVGPVQGWQFTRTSENGLPLEVIEMNGAELSYVSMTYGRWDLFKQRLSKVLGNIPMMLGDVLSRRVTILDYTDRFVFDGDPLRADATFLLGDLARTVPDAAASGGELWHINRGWFQETSSRRILVNVNLATQDGRLDDKDNVRSVQAFTRTEVRHVEKDRGVEMLFEDLDVLHTVSKKAFGDSISDDAKKMIGMADGA